MNQIDEKILRIIDLLIYQKRISTARNFCQEINLLEQTLSKIKKGTAHFTPTHIQNICKVYKVNSNWIFGLEENMFIYNKNKSFNQNSTLIKKSISLIKPN
jgi:hypothetical protein